MIKCPFPEIKEYLLKDFTRDILITRAIVEVIHALMSENFK